MLLTVNLLAESLVSSAELLLCLRDSEWPRVCRDRASDADIQEELARMVRMIEDCDIWFLAAVFVVRSKCILLLDLGAQTTVRQNLGCLVFDAVADRVAALDTASGQMDSVAVERDCALAFFAVAHRTGDDTLLMKEEP